MQIQAVTALTVGYFGHCFGRYKKVAGDAAVGPAYVLDKCDQEAVFKERFSLAKINLFERPIEAFVDPLLVLESGTQCVRACTVESDGDGRSIRMPHTGCGATRTQCTDFPGIRLWNLAQGGLTFDFTTVLKDLKACLRGVSQPCRLFLQH